MTNIVQKIKSSKILSGKASNKRTIARASAEAGSPVPVSGKPSSYASHSKSVGGNHHRSFATRFSSITLILILASSMAITPYGGNAIFNGIFSIFSLFGQANATPGITYPIAPTHEDLGTVCTEADLFSDPGLTQSKAYPVTFGSTAAPEEQY